VTTHFATPTPAGLPLSRSGSSLTSYAPLVATSMCLIFEICSELSNHGFVPLGFSKLKAIFQNPVLFLAKNLRDVS
jgi:hypothetical protein